MQCVRDGASLLTVPAAMPYPSQGKGTVKNKRGDLISCLLTFDP